MGQPTPTGAPAGTGVGLVIPANPVSSAYGHHRAPASARYAPGMTTSRGTPQTPPHHWDPQPGDRERIEEHLRRQRDLPAEFVRLDTGQISRVGADAEGEGAADVDC